MPTPSNLWWAATRRSRPGRPGSGGYPRVSQCPAAASETRRSSARSGHSRVASLPASRDGHVFEHQRLTCLVAQQAFSACLGKALLPAPDHRATDASFGRNLLHRSASRGGKNHARTLDIFACPIAVRRNRRKHPPSVPPRWSRRAVVPPHSPRCSRASGSVNSGRSAATAAGNQSRRITADRSYAGLPELEHFGCRARINKEEMPVTPSMMDQEYRCSANNCCMATELSNES
jgi:hypothetical protein